MPAAFVDERARTALRDAVVAVEAQSSAEIVIAVRRQSAAYLHTNLVVGACVSFAALAYMLGASTPFSLTAILVDPFALGVAAALLAELVAPLKRYLTPAQHRRRTVERAARATFVERGVHGTTGRTGILVYASWVERHATLVCDLGVLAAMPPSSLAAAGERVQAAMRRDGAALAAAVAQLGPELARYLPRSADDVNERPDDVDAHAGRRARATAPPPTTGGAA
ncbi:MAG: hypothetical protein R2939_19630 [Kofleriaceae bacterium]